VSYLQRFKYDITLPQTTVSYPNEQYNIYIQTFTGTYSDPNFGSGVYFVKIRIRRKSDDNYWQDPGWNPDSAELPAVKVDASNWEWYLDPSYFSDFYSNEETYYIYSLAQDEAGNSEGWSVIKSSFIYEVDLPTATITYPVNNGFVTATGKVEGTSADFPSTGKVQKVQCRLKRDFNKWHILVFNFSFLGDRRYLLFIL